MAGRKDGATCPMRLRPVVVSDDLRRMRWLKRSLPAEPWKESSANFAKRMKKAVDHVNKEHDVRGLCREMPARMHSLVHETLGDRLRQ